MRTAICIAVAWALLPGVGAGWIPALGAGAGGPSPYHGFDGSVATPVTAGCAGSPSDWLRVRDTADPRNGTLRSAGVENESCVLLPGGRLRDGTVSVRLRLEEERAGLALRHRDPNHYIGIYLEPASGIVTALEWDGQRSRSLGTALFDSPPGGEFMTLTAVLKGGRVAVLQDGRQILAASGATETGGESGLLAGPLAVAEFDEAGVEAWPPGRALLVTPAFAPELRVGREAGWSLGCVVVGEASTAGPACEFTLESGALPPGMALEEDGLLGGIPDRPGRFTAVVRATSGTALSAARTLRFDVTGHAWPRFPVDGKSGEEPTLAVLYTPDDIGQTIAMSTLGEPGDVIFRMHADHPALKIMLMSCPANRYISEKPVTEWPRGKAVWQRLALDPGYAWVDLGGHGYTHSPPGDTNKDHHEFDPRQSGCNIDHATVADPDYCDRQMSAARAIYRELGIPDQSVYVFRFPGAVDNPEALRAMRAAGFLAVLGRRHRDEAGREWWIPDSDGGEILEIEDTMLNAVFAESAALEERLAAGTLAPEAVTRSPDFREAVKRGVEYAAEVEGQGGILNLVDHFWETFKEIGGAQPRYLVLDAVLDAIEAGHEGRIWHPRAGELAQWLEARRFAEVGWTGTPEGVVVTVTPPSAWTALGLPGLDRASLRIALPGKEDEVESVTLQEGSAPPRRLERRDHVRDGADLLVSFPFRGPVRIQVATRKPGH